ncbi:MAG: hypothetical protein ACI9QD_000175 [Thermoproteota archaeon]|jgi:hypothetical protein
MKSKSITMNTEYTKIFLLAAQYLEKKKNNKRTETEEEIAYQTFYTDEGKKRINHILTPKITERAYIINLYQKKLLFKHRVIASVGPVRRNTISSRTKIRTR